MRSRNPLFFESNVAKFCQTLKLKTQKANSTLRASRAVPHPSTDRAFRRLTSEFGWDRVYSTKYGRWRKLTPRIENEFDFENRIFEAESSKAGIQAVTVAILAQRSARGDACAQPHIFCEAENNCANQENYKKPTAP